MTVSFDEFVKNDLRVITVKGAERIEGSEKLLKLSIDIGEAEDRILIAGIGRQYAPEELVGKQFLIIANLEPRTMMGVESRGMMLATDDDQGIVLLQPSRPVPAGSKLH